MIRALIFDRDLTLLYLHPGRIAELERRLRGMAATLRFGEILSALEHWDGFLPGSADAEPRLWRELAGRLAALHRLDRSDRTHLVDLLSHYYDYFAAYDDVLPALQELRRRGYRMAVLTNSPLPTVEKTLARGGIDPGLFEVLASRASLHVAKPDPTAFMRVAALLALPAEECALVDDQPEHVAIARTLGMGGWTLSRGGCRLDDLVSLSELPYVLGQQESPPWLTCTLEVKQQRDRMMQADVGAGVDCLALC